MEGRGKAGLGGVERKYGGDNGWRKEISNFIVVQGLVKKTERKTAN